MGLNRGENVNLNSNHRATELPAPNVNAGFFNWRDLKTRPQATIEDPETETDTDTIEQPGLKMTDFTFKYTKEAWEDTTPNPSLVVNWDANGTHPDKALTPPTNEEYEENRKKKEELEQERYHEFGTPVTPHNPGAALLQRIEENQRRTKQQAEELMTKLLAYGAKPPRSARSPTPLEDYTPIEPTPSTPINPRIERNRFGTISPPNGPVAPKTSPGGRHMGEGSQKVSLVPIEDLKITPGGEHAMMGTTRFTLPQFFKPDAQAQPAVPVMKVPPPQVQPAVPEPQPSRPPSSSGSSVSVIEIVPQKIKGPLPQHPVQVLGERYPPRDIDAEGDSPMVDNITQGRQGNPIALSETPTQGRQGNPTLLSLPKNAPPR